MADFSESDDEYFSDFSDFSGSGNEEDSYFDHSNSAPSKESAPAPKKVSKHILQLKEKLGLDSLKEKKKQDLSPSETKPVRVQTLAGNLKPHVQPEVVVYKAPGKKKPKTQENSKNEKMPEQQEEMNIHKIKHDVRRLGIQALDKTSREEAKAALAISLGAIPAKNKGINYKVLKEEKKKELEEEKRRKEMDEVFAARLKTMNKKRDNKKKDKNKVKNFDAQFGKFDGGVQRINKFQLKRLTNKKK